MLPSRLHHHVCRWLRHATLFVFLLLVSACSTDDGSTGKLEPVQPQPGIDGSLDDFAEQARRRYRGVSAPASLAPSSAARFFDIALWGPFRRDTLRSSLSSPRYWQALDSAIEPSVLPQEYMNIPCSENQTESSTTTQLEVPGLERVRLLVERVHCTHGSRTTLTLDYVDGRLAESWHGYDRVIVARSSYQKDRLLKVSGMVHKTAADKCPSFGASVATLLIEDLDTGEQVLVDGFERASRHTYDIPCYQNYDWESQEFYGNKLEDPRNWFSGLISHSSLGSMVVSTAEHLGLAVDASQYHGINVWPVYRQNADGILEYAPGGPVVLTGLDGQTATLETAYTAQERTPRSAHMKLSLFDNDGSLTGEYRASTAAFKCGALSDTKDTDDDGLPDAWESCHDGLDPTTADADADPDNDGLSNREEYELMLWPDSSEGAAVSGGQGLAVRMSSEFDSEPGLIRYSVSANAFALNSAAIPDNNTFVLTIDGESTWDLDRLPVECVAQAESIQSVICTIDYGDQTKLRKYYGSRLFFTRGSVTQGSLTATLVADAMDLVLRITNPQTTVEKEIKRRLWVNMPTWSAGHSDESRFLRVNVEQSSWITDPGLKTTATFDVPEGVVIESAYFDSDIGNGYPDYVAHDCSIGNSVICEIDNADYSYRYLDIYIHYYVVQPGSHDIKWSFSAEGHDKKQVLLSQTTVLEQYRSTTSLQALIDDAIAGHPVTEEVLVTLPGGAYAGTLHGRNHALILRGETDGEPTILAPPNSRSYIAEGLGDESRLEHLEMRNTGTTLIEQRRSRFHTIAHSLIVPLPNQSHNVSNLLSTSRARYSLIGNEFRGWGTGDGNRCESLLSLSSNEYAFVDHNTFIDNHCDRLIDVDASMAYANAAPEPLVLVVQNNTFVGNPSLIHLKPQGDPYFIHLKNNIVVGANSIFVAEPEPDSNQRMAGSTILSAGNLLWNNATMSILPAEPSVRARALIEVGDVHADPLFASEGQTSLSSWSPAIDAGVEPTTPRALLPLLRDYQDKTQEQADVPREPLDGLGDGNAVHDIGSHEYVLPE